MVCQFHQETRGLFTHNEHLLEISESTETYHVILLENRCIHELESFMAA